MRHFAASRLDLQRLVTGEAQLVTELLTPELLTLRSQGPPVSSPRSPLPRQYVPSLVFSGECGDEVASRLAKNLELCWARGAYAALPAIDSGGASQTKQILSCGAPCGSSRGAEMDVSAVASAGCTWSELGRSSDDGACRGTASRCSEGRRTARFSITVRPVSTYAITPDR